MATGRAQDAWPMYLQAKTRCHLGAPRARVLKSPGVVVEDTAKYAAQNMNEIRRFMSWMSRCPSYTHTCVRVSCVSRGCLFFGISGLWRSFLINCPSLSRSRALSRSLSLSRAHSLYNSASGNKLSRLDSQFHQSLILAERFRRTLLPSSARGMGPA
jgi:hypothetical protein